MPVARRYPGGGFHAIPQWVFGFLFQREIFEALGANGYATFYDAVTGVMPLLLCFGAPLRNGLSLGRWRGAGLQVAGICALPVVLTAIVDPFTSQPFSGGPIGIWLVSPLAQDLLFVGFLYGLFEEVFPGEVFPRFRINRSMLLTAAFFALWHVPSFANMAPAYVALQLLYVSLGAVWRLQARRLTGTSFPESSCIWLATLWRGC